jgi:lipopolysaccharide transport system permease protein
MSITTTEPAPSSQGNRLGDSTPEISVAQGAGVANLPSDPLVVIEPSKAWKLIDVRDIWRHRELLYFLIWRDLKIRYKQAVFGIAWVVLQPLALTATFTIFLGKLARVPSTGAPYAVFVLSALVIWTFFSGALMNSSGSLTGNAHLLTKVYFPRVIIPLTAIGARFLDFLISFVILLGLVVYYRVPVTRTVLLLPLPIFAAILLLVGCGLLLSAINVKYRDVGVVIPVLTQLWMFLSPIIYPSDLVPQRWRTLYALNPLVGIIESFRAIILGRAFDGTALAMSFGISLVILLISIPVFRRMEAAFADNV